jgi:hypothetical protein
MTKSQTLNNRAKSSYTGVRSVKWPLHLLVSLSLFYPTQKMASRVFVLFTAAVKQKMGESLLSLAAVHL